MQMLSQLFIFLLLLPFVVIGKIFSLLFGKINWYMPPWLAYLNSLRTRSPVRFILLMVCVSGAVFGTYKSYIYYQSLPEAILIEAIITLPDASYELDDERFAQDETNKNKHIAPLRVEFAYTSQKDRPNLPIDGTPELRPYSPLSEAFPSVAPIDGIGDTINAGIKLSPNIPGTWSWVDDRTLVFQPDTPWPAGQEYELSFAPTVFQTEETFIDDQFSFTTAPLQANLEASEFELSIEEKRKQVYVEMLFNYPVDIASVRDALSVAYQRDGNKLDKQEIYKLSVSDDARYVSVILDVPELPEQARILEITFEQGIQSVYGGQRSQQTYTSTVMVPDVYSYLTVEESDTDVLRNPDGEPEQFILLGFTDAISRTELLNKLTLHLLPKQPEKNGKNYWRSPREVSTQVLKDAQQVDFTLMPSEESGASQYQLKIDVAEGRQLYLKLDSGLRSVNGFVQRAFFDRILAAPRYPQEVIISGEGSVLTHSQDQRLAFLTRGISDVQVNIGKVIDEELYHLVSQTQGDISHPDFMSWSFDENNLAEFTSQYISMNSNNGDLKSANYASVDLNALVSKSKGGLGLFFVEIKGWDKKRKRALYDVSDKLLLLVTDLGVIVKTGQDQRQDIFVQSIKSGKPVANAQVQLIAKNGTQLFSKTTSSEGHISFPSVDGFKKEKQPVVYVVRHNGDVSFIPFDRYTRQINYSRFNVGGEYSYANQNDGVNAFLFTDRGIYRPGEAVNIGMIVKGKHLQSVDNIPLELVIRDAQYTQVHDEKLTLAKLGFMDSVFQTKKSFKTGTYSASLHLVRDRRNGASRRGRQVGALSFEVEEFQADTMSITSQVSGLPSTGWTNNANLVNEVTLSNLFGVPAQGRRVTSELTVQAQAFSFNKYADLSFYSPIINDESSDGLSRINETLDEQQTDADGRASVAVDLGRFVKGTYRVSLQTKGFEASGGRSVSTTSSLLYSPSKALVGYKADGNLAFVKLNSERTINLLAINNELSPVALGNLSKRVSKVQSISTLVKQYNGRYEYESIESKVPISEEAYALSEGMQALSIETSQAGTFMIELFNENNDLLTSIEYTVVGETNETGALDKSAELKVTLDKTDYQEGETIELSIQAPYSGSGLISIESNKLHAFAWFTSDTKSSVQRIKIPTGIEGNAYVNVAFVRDINAKEIFTSPLSYAVQPFSIDRGKRILDLTLDIGGSNNITQPGKPMAINLNLSQDAKVAVFAVDLGILQVANYRTPNPLDHFLKKRALDVRTMQILDLILPDFALSQMLSAAGGGMADEFAEKIMVTGSRLMRSENPFERKVRDPAVFWSGVVTAKKGNNTYTFDVPNDFAGGLRVMAIAVGEDKMGRAQKTTVVRGPFVLSPNVLNQAAPGDEFDITLSVANVVQDSPENALVNIKLSTSEHVSIVGNDTATMRLNRDQEDSVRFRLKANQLLGAADINFDVNLTDASGKTWQATRSTSLSVRPAMPFEVNISTGAVDDKKVSIDTPLTLFAENATQVIKASASPLVIVEGLSAYLDEYPHGCTEQIVSQVFPLIGLSNLAEYAPDNEKVSSHFAVLIEQLRQRQNYSGGFSYWPALQTDDIDVSLYVMHFLIEAKSLNYPVPQDMLASGVSYLNMLAREYANSSTVQSIAMHRAQAQNIYLLTRSGMVTSNLIIDLVSALNKQHSTTWRGDILSTYVAASYALMQQDAEAQRLVTSYDVNDDNLMIQQAFAGMAPRLTLDAQYVYLVAKHFPQQLQDMSQQAILNITQAIYKGQYNTVSAAYSVLALGAYHSAITDVSGASVANAEQIAMLAQIDKQIDFFAVSRQQETVPLTARYQPFASAEYPIGTARIQASLPSGVAPDTGALYYVNMQAGFQRELPSNAVTNGIEIQRAFIDKNGSVASEIKQGDELTVRLRVRSTSLNKIDNIAIVDLLPGGFEVIRESLERRSTRWQSDYTDIREDRIIFYGDISNRVTEITYQVNVTAAGEFSVPPSFVEAMYDRSLSGYSAASRLTVETVAK